MKEILIAVVLAMSFSVLNAKEIPTNRVVQPKDLLKYLKKEAKQQAFGNNKVNEAKLAAYFRNTYSNRYFFNWNNFEERFKEYQSIYLDKKQSHLDRAEDHMQKYADSTLWKLPFNYLNGEAVNAYALRHLARQHKMVDIAFRYYYENKRPEYINYFTGQMHSLNAALTNNKYETIEDGNGVYEAFRSGYRVLNWLQIHGMFLSQKHYNDSDQLTTIATLLQHGAHLYINNQEFKSGNHQTRGLSALAMLSILFRDFEGTDKWYEKAMSLLEEHLQKEINEDGFQFERSVHYHMSDINNFYYVYRLAQISDLPVSDMWTNKMESLFTTLAKIAYPDKSAPVLQDDTDIPWGEKNDISGAITLGYLLFEDPVLGHFSNDNVDAKTYWFLNKAQLTKLDNIQSEAPSMGSLCFQQTGYYIMRQGWDANDKMMIISAGLDDKKPDHQHGDMLGIQAMANGSVVLPNYQVRYSLPDLEQFKNSLTKNVALVDDELQGKKYTSNKGGSGFGKFKELPKPKTIAWATNETFDLFIGTHNGFNNVGVDYTRKVIFVKDDFWIVKDDFKSNKEHTYKQVWQGHYTSEHSPQILRSSFDNGSGLDILQLTQVDNAKQYGARGKHWSIIEQKSSGDGGFITILHPFSSYSKRINELDSNPIVDGWKHNSEEFVLTGSNTTSISNDVFSLFFNVTSMTSKDLKIEFEDFSDFIIERKGNNVSITSTSSEAIALKATLKQRNSSARITLKPGESAILFSN
ncbi:heparinase II/III family protein [Carboxylicivirga sp. M1479]|uniref:heparinase II/III family protein n=1 Tax=Carboxylicivirga sp. M1479 TaxID=2594476 RepID=UPI001178147B|nr:heparinase II/III family protein [Carboxylicivirga sp. M1479]TRX72637.1 heparinase [Carboxylicivirga sp. M1479]